MSKKKKIYWKKTKLVSKCENRKSERKFDHMNQNIRKTKISFRKIFSAKWEKIFTVYKENLIYIYIFIYNVALYKRSSLDI